MRVLTIGTFDLLHHGHLRLLERAATLGDLTVGVNTDTFVQHYKHRLPAQTAAERAANLAAAGFNAVISHGPGIDLIRDTRPDLLAAGSDWLGRDYPAQLGTTPVELTELGVAVLFLPRTPGVSTTELRAA